MNVMLPVYPQVYQRFRTLPLPMHCLTEKLPFPVQKTPRQAVIRFRLEKTAVHGHITFIQVILNIVTGNIGNLVIRNYSLIWCNKWNLYIWNLCHIIRGYQIQIRKNGGAWTHYVHTGYWTKEWAFEPNTDYQIRMRAYDIYNGKYSYSSNWSEILSFTTKIGNGKVLNLWYTCG